MIVKSTSWLRDVILILLSQQPSFLICLGCIDSTHEGQADDGLYISKTGSRFETNL